MHYENLYQKVKNMPNIKKWHVFLFIFLQTHQKKNIIEENGKRGLLCLHPLFYYN